MGAADDIKKGLTKNLANFTKQRKAEEKHSSAGRWRMSRMIEVRGKFLTEAANEVMEECYMKASDNNRLPATARQIFYVARPLIEEQTDKPLSYSYFSQTLLPNFVNEHGADWDVVYDDRGHFTEPHTKRVIGLGTLNVRAYLSRVASAEVGGSGFRSGLGQDLRPEWQLRRGALCRKRRLHAAVQAGQAGEALRHRHHVVRKACRSRRRASWSIASAAGASRCWCCMISIRPGSSSRTPWRTIPGATATRHRPTSSTSGCTTATSTACRLNPTIPTSATSGSSQAGLDQAAIDFLRSQRVELNAMTSRQLVDFVERQAQAARHRQGDPRRRDLGENLRDVRRERSIVGGVRGAEGKA